MHSVQRSPEPDFLAQLRSSHTQWNDLEDKSRRRIRTSLRQDFGRVCAYCEQQYDPEAYRNVHNAETIDHFRPRSRFPGLSFDWLNLIYACYRCNQSKGNSWPGYDDEITNKILAARHTQYTPPSEYVDPNATAGHRPTHEFFDFDVDTGEIAPASELDDLEWSTARRTIWDIDLNDKRLGENDHRHLWNLRRYQRYLLIEALNSVDDTNAKIQMLAEFIKPDKPFSGFIRAYLMHSFPQFADLFPHY